MAGHGSREAAFSNDEKVCYCGRHTTCEPTNEDQNYLLAEILKSASPSPAHLLGIVIHLGIQPSWEDIPLPSGMLLIAASVTLVSRPALTLVRTIFELLSDRFRGPKAQCRLLSNVSSSTDAAFCSTASWPARAGTIETIIPFRGRFLHTRPNW